VLPTFINELPLCPLDPEHALMIGERETCCTNWNCASSLGIVWKSGDALGKQRDSNSVRFLVMVVGLPLSLKFKGLHGAIVTLVLVEVCRYAPVYIGQRRQRLSFGAQDVAIMLAMFAMIGLWELLRWACGLGTSFDSFFT
jgi:hypothetical protein